MVLTEVEVHQGEARQAAALEEVQMAAEGEVTVEREEAAAEEVSAEAAQGAAAREAVTREVGRAMVEGEAAAVVGVTGCGMPTARQYRGRWARRGALSSRMASRQIWGRAVSAPCPPCPHQ